MNRFFWTLSLMLMIVGGIALAVSNVVRTYFEKRQKYSGKAVATVVEIEIDEPDKRGREKGIHDYFYAVFAYYADGRLYKKRYARGGNPCPFYLNQKIRIQYDEENPEKFRIAVKRHYNYLVPALYYGGMCAVCTGGLLFLLAAMRLL